MFFMYKLNISKNTESTYCSLLHKIWLPMSSKIILKCSHELACFYDFLDTKKGYEILKYKKNTLFE